MIQGAMSSENGKTPHAGLPLPHNIMAGDMNATVFKQDVQRAKLDMSNVKHQEFIKDLLLRTTYPTNTHIGSTLCARQQTAAKTVELN